MNKYLIKINRFSVWILFIFILIYFLTGFDILKNLWQPDFSRYLHNQLLPLPTLALFLFHSGIGIKLLLVRNKLEDKFFDLILVIFCLLIFSLFAYLLYR